MSGKQKPIFNTSHILTSLAIGAILGAYALVRVSDSQTVILAGHTQELANLENSIVPRTEFEQTILRIDQRLESIEKRIDSVDGKLDRLLSR
jgi:hypothetical protein